MNPEKVCANQRGVIGKGFLGVRLGSSLVAWGQNCLRGEQTSLAAGHGFPVVEHEFEVVGQEFPLLRLDSAVVEQGALVLAQTFPVVRLDFPEVQKEAVVVGQKLPLMRLDSPIAEQVALVLGQKFPFEKLNSPVLEQETVVVGEEFPVVTQDSLCVRQCSLHMRKHSLNLPTNRGSLFGNLSEPVVTLVSNFGKSSWQNQTSTAARGSGNFFWSLSVILVFLLTVIDVTSAGQCPSISEDLASRTVLAKAVFVGQLVGQEPTVEMIWTAEFKVEELLKGTDLLSKSRVHVLGLSREEGDTGCARVNFTVKGKYFVFLNGSTEDQSDGEDGPRRIYWTSGPPVEFSKAAKKTIVRYSCPNCAEAPTVKPMPRSLPPIDRSGSLILLCRTSGRPTPTVTWYKEAEVVSVDGRRIKTLRHGTQLSIRRVKPSDAGLYKCQASNVLGSVNSTSVSVTVKDKAWTSPIDHAVQCDQQVFCVNGGTCFTNPTLGQFCKCPQEFTGHRCQDRSISRGETKPRPQKPLDMSLRNLLVVGLILIGLILLVLTVIAYCLAMTRYDNARRMSQWTAEDVDEPDVRANGALLRSLNGLQSEKLQKFTASNGAGDSSVDENKRVGGLPQVLVTLIDDEDRTRTTITSGKGEHPPPGNAKRPEVCVYCPTDQCATFPNLSRPRLAAVSTTPSSAASSINLQMDHAGQTTVEEQLGGSNC